MLLIIGTDFLYQTEQVIKKLQKKGIETYVIDFAKSNPLTVELTSNGLFINNISTSKFKLAWLQSKFIFPLFGQDDAWVEFYINGKMNKLSYENLIACLECEILNSKESRQICATKLNQLYLAQKLGFKVPPTLLTNEIDKISSCFKGNNAIVKAIGDPHIPNIRDGVISQESLFTSEIDYKYLTLNAGKIEPFPIYTQEKIKKKYEFRCILVEDEVFSFKIDPLQHEIMNVDYRLGGYLVDYIPCEIPEDVHHKLISFAKKCKLFSGCFDLIQNIDGDFVFLEVNPQGIWGLHDDILEGKISSKFATSIVNRLTNINEKLH